MDPRNPYINQARSGGPQMNGHRGAQTLGSVTNVNGQRLPAGEAYGDMASLNDAWRKTINGHMVPRNGLAGSELRAPNQIDDLIPSDGTPSPAPSPPTVPITPAGTLLPGLATPSPINSEPIPLPPPPPPGGGRRRSAIPGNPNAGNPADGVPLPIDPPEPQPLPPRPPREGDPSAVQRSVEDAYGISLDEIQRMGGNSDQYGTFIKWIGDGMSKFGQEAMRPYVEQLRRAPGRISLYFRDAQRAKDEAGIEGMHFVDWYAETYGAGLSPLAGQMGPGSADAARRWQELKRAGSRGAYGGHGTIIERPGPSVIPRNQTETPPTPPPREAPHTDPVIPPPVEQSPTTLPSPPPPTPLPPPGQSETPPVPQDFDPGVLRAADVDYLDPVYKDAMDQVRRQMMQVGANRGTLDSGGFGSMLARELSPIANQFAAEKGQLQFQAQQANADRILDKYKFDNAQDLERFLAGNKDALDRYGIDQNVLLQRWVQENRAQLEREGFDVQKWIAEMQAKYGLRQAQIGAQAAGAAANASAQAARYNADLDYSLGMSRLGYDFWNSAEGRRYDDLFNQRGYDLGVLGINRDVYGMDQAQMRYLLDLMRQQSPEARMQMINLPGMYPY